MRKGAWCFPSGEDTAAPAPLLLLCHDDDADDALGAVHHAAPSGSSSKSFGQYTGCTRRLEGKADTFGDVGLLPPPTPVPLLLASATGSMSGCTEVGCPRAPSPAPAAAANSTGAPTFPISGGERLPRREKSRSGSRRNPCGPNLEANVDSIASAFWGSKHPSIIT